MKKNRIIGIFTAIAIIAAVVVSFAVYTYLNPARGTIYVFNNDYQSGEPVTREILTPVQVDSNVFVGSAGGSINDQFVTGENFSKVVTSGDTLKMNVSKGMPLTPSMLSKIGGSSIEMAMNPQSVAISIPVNNISGVTSDLQSGAVVNLYYAEGSQGNQSVSLLLQRVKVLAVYRSEGELTSVSLELKPEEALKVVYAENYGSIYLGIIDGSSYQEIEDKDKMTYSADGQTYNMDSADDYRALINSINGDETEAEISGSNVISDETETPQAPQSETASPENTAETQTSEIKAESSQSEMAAPETSGANDIEIGN